MAQLIQPPNNIKLTQEDWTSPIWGRWFLSVYNAIVNPDISSFRAYVGSNQSIGTGAATKVQYNTKSYDITNKFDSITDYRYRPKISGVYVIRAQVLWNTSAAAYTHTLQIYKNGSAVSSDVKQQTFVAGTITQEVSDSLQLTADDYIEVFATQNSGGSLNINSGSGNSFFIASQQ